MPSGRAREIAAGYGGNFRVYVGCGTGTPVETRRTGYEGGRRHAGDRLPSTALLRRHDRVQPEGPEAWLHWAGAPSVTEIRSYPTSEVRRPLVETVSRAIGESTGRGCSFCSAPTASRKARRPGRPYRSETERRYRGDAVVSRPPHALSFQSRAGRAAWLSPTRWTRRRVSRGRGPEPGRRPGELRLRPHRDAPRARHPAAAHARKWV